MLFIMLYVSTQNLQRSQTFNVKCHFAG